MFEKEYSADNEYSEEYPEVEWMSDNSKRFYKKIPIEISDEEYAELLKYKSHEIKKHNLMAVIFKVLAWIIVVGGFVGGIVASNETKHSFVTAMIWWASSSGSALFFFGFAEIIQLLNDIKNGQRRAD